MNSRGDSEQGGSERVASSSRNYQPMPNGTSQSWWPLVGGVLLMLVLLGGTLTFSLLGGSQPQPAPSPARSTTAP